MRLNNVTCLKVQSRQFTSFLTLLPTVYINEPAFVTNNLLLHFSFWKLLFVRVIINSYNRKKHSFLSSFTNVELFNLVNFYFAEEREKKPKAKKASFQRI